MSSTKVDAEKVTNDLIQLPEERGKGNYIGVAMSQLERCLQCAKFARQAGADVFHRSKKCKLFWQYLGSSEETIIAALLHNIGQFFPVDAAKDVQMGIGSYSVGRVGHEKIGEEYLKTLGFGEKVSRLVRSHVATKRWVFIQMKGRGSGTWARYPTAVDASYYDGLSEASKQSLKFQGGPFEGEELEGFERYPLREEMVGLRRWDDGANIVGVECETPRAEMYRGTIRRHLER
jgi:predicted HD phosphohydrolase